MSQLDVGRIVVDKLGSSLWVVELGGEHDLATVGKLHTTLETIFAQGTTVVLDLSSTTFIDSSILGELVSAQQRADANPMNTSPSSRPKTGRQRESSPWSASAASSTCSKPAPTP